jgi:hypothetical protein
VVTFPYASDFERNEDGSLDADLHGDLHGDLHSTVQDDGQVTREERILKYCATPRTRKEVQEYAGISH